MKCKLLVVSSDLCWFRWRLISGVCVMPVFLPKNGPKKRHFAPGKRGQNEGKLGENGGRRGRRGGEGGGGGRETGGGNGGNRGERNGAGGLWVQHRVYHTDFCGPSQRLSNMSRVAPAPMGQWRSCIELPQPSRMLHVVALLSSICPRSERPYPSLSTSRSNSIANRSTALHAPDARRCRAQRCDGSQPPPTGAAAAHPSTAINVTGHKRGGGDQERASAQQTARSTQVCPGPGLATPSVTRTLHLSKDLMWAEAHANEPRGLKGLSVVFWGCNHTVWLGAGGGV